MISFEVRNRRGMTVLTFSHADRAIKHASAVSDAVVSFEVFCVEPGREDQQVWPLTAGVRKLRLVKKVGRL